MKGIHLNLWLPEELARALERAAALRGTDESFLVREAVANHLAGTSDRDSPRVVRGGDLAERWSRLPVLLPEESAALSDDIDEARSTLPPAPDRLH